MTEWNTEVENFEVKIKLDANSYLCALKVKKYSYVSWPRSAALLISALKY